MGEETTIEQESKVTLDFDGEKKTKRHLEVRAVITTTRSMFENSTVTFDFVWNNYENAFDRKLSTFKAPFRGQYEFKFYGDIDNCTGQNCRLSIVHLPKGREVFKLISGLTPEYTAYSVTIHDGAIVQFQAKDKLDLDCTADHPCELLITGTELFQ